MDNTKPLVSIVVITYNSSKYVIETLDSIYEQTYPNIELIITDDCSKDNTVDICRTWINKHKQRFLNAIILTSKSNQGIPANCNQGYSTAQGEWIKAIAGDDCLYPYAIERYMDIASENDYSIYFSSMDVFENNFNENNITTSHLLPIPLIQQNKMTAKEQYKLLSINNHIFAPAVIMKKDLYYKMGKYDEEIKLCEDWPMWLKITRQGYPFYYIDEALVKYRKYSESTSGKQSFNIKYIVFNGEEIIKRKYIYPYAGWIKRSFLKLDLFTRKELNIAGKSLVNRFILKFGNKISEKYLKMLLRLYKLESIIRTKIGYTP